MRRVQPGAHTRVGSDPLDNWRGLDNAQVVGSCSRWCQFWCQLGLSICAELCAVVHVRVAGRLAETKGIALSCIPVLHGATCSDRIRSPTLYPTELRARMLSSSYTKRATAFFSLVYRRASGVAPASSRLHKPPRWRRYQRHAVTLLYTIPKNAVEIVGEESWEKVFQGGE